MTLPETLAVIAALGAEGAEVRFVGGCVRDTLLGRSIGDIDIATPDPPEHVQVLLARDYIRALPTGIEHGTVTAVIGARHYEITTLRVDRESHGRRATVAFTDDWQADAARRDLTINAMSLAPDGALYDPFGGAADLEAGRVRFVGEPRQRIEEDHLRLLRFFRFHAYFGRGAPDEAGVKAARESAFLLPRLSGERVQAEMKKLLLAPQPMTVLGAMQACGVLTQIVPEAAAFASLAAMIGIEQRSGRAPDAIRRLAALMRGRDPAPLAERWKLSNADASRLAALATPEPSLNVTLGASGQRRLLYRWGAERFVDQVLLAWSEAEASGQSNQAPWRAMLEGAAVWQPRALPIKGADVLALGVPAGPAVGRILARLEDWWIEEDFAPDEATLRIKLRALIAGGAA